jgi:hypothetical protein
MRAGMLALLCIISLFLTAANASAQSGQVMVWPPTGSPVLRFTFGKFKEVSNSGSRHNYTTEVTAENLWGKIISNATFTLYAYDKSKARVGDAWVTVNDMDPGAVILIGDVESMSPSDVIVRIAGANQRITRNKVKRILLVKREEPQ